MKSKQISWIKRANSAIGIISSQFPTQPEAKLFLAVIERSILDIALVMRRYDELKKKPTEKRLRKFNVIRAEVIGSIRKLSGQIYFAEACGVDSDWVRQVIKRCGLPLDLPRR